MHLDSVSALVTGGSSGLGLATVRRLLAAGARVGIADLNPPSDEDLAGLGAGVVYAKTDITDEAAVTAALDAVEAAHGPLRAVVHCAGRGGDRVRILDKEGNPGSLETFAEVVRVNLVGTYNVLRLGAARIARAEPVDGRARRDRPHRVGRRLRRPDRPDVLHRRQGGRARHHPGRRPRPRQQADPGQHDRARRLRHPDAGPAAAGHPRRPWSRACRNPSRLGAPDDYAHMAISLLENPYVNGETIRLDGAIRMPPR